MSGYSLEHSYRNRCIGFVTKFEVVEGDKGLQAQNVVKAEEVQA